MIIIIIPISVDALRMIPKETEVMGNQKKNQLHTDQSTVKNTEESPVETCCHLDFFEKPPVKISVKNS